MSVCFGFSTLSCLDTALFRFFRLYFYCCYSFNQVGYGMVNSQRRVEFGGEWLLLLLHCCYCGSGFWFDAAIMLVDDHEDIIPWWILVEKV